MKSSLEFHDKIFSKLGPYIKRGVCPLTLQNDGTLTQTPGKQIWLLLKPVWDDDAPISALARIAVIQS